MRTWLCALAFAVSSISVLSAQVVENHNIKFPADSPFARPEVSTFAKAINASGVYDLFQGTGPFTVFVPTNDAFEKLGKEKVDNLFKAENKDQLTTILLYHVIPGKYIAHTIKSENVRTLNGKTLSLQNDHGQVTINNAKLIKADLTGPNGVAHEIDTVLIP